MRRYNFSARWHLVSAHTYLPSAVLVKAMATRMKKSSLLPPTAEGFRLPEEEHAAPRLRQHGPARRRQGVVGGLPVAGGGGRICLKYHAPFSRDIRTAVASTPGERHLIAMSLSGGVWDYGQVDPLDVYAIPKLRAPYAALHLAKFGEPPSFPGAPVLELGAAPTAENDFLQATDAVTTAVKAYKELWGDDPRYAAARELLMAILESKT